MKGRVIPVIGMMRSVPARITKACNPRVAPSPAARSAPKSDEARSAMRAVPPADALLLDLHLPDGSGLDFLRDLRKQGGTARLPVLVLTAEGEDRILREARRLGAALVTKPFSPTKLSQRIAMMFGDIKEGEPE